MGDDDARRSAYRNTVVLGSRHRVLGPLGFPPLDPSDVVDGQRASRQTHHSGGGGGVISRRPQPTGDDTVDVGVERFALGKDLQPERRALGPTPDESGLVLIELGLPVEGQPDPSVPVERAKLDIGEPTRADDPLQRLPERA